MYIMNTNNLELKGLIEELNQRNLNITKEDNYTYDVFADLGIERID